MNKLIRITTVPISLEKLLENQLRFMNDYYEVIAVCSDEKALEKVGKTQGVRTFTAQLTRKITPIQDLKAVWQLYLFFRKEKPLLVHSHTPKAGTVGMLAAKLAGVPHRLHTVAGLPLMEASGSKRKLLNFVEKITYWCATKVYPNSKGLKSIILQEGFCKEDKLKVIGNGSSNGINIDFFDPNQIKETDKVNLKEELQLSNEDFVFIFVGRIVGDKGINELASAFDRLSSERKNIKLILVGPLEDELDPLLESTKKILTENKAILSVGYQNDVRPFFAVSDCLVFPSYREGFPNVVMQAGAMGLPSIVSNINGCNEIVQQEENGLIIASKSENELLQSMQKLLDEKVLFEKMKKNAREKIVTRFDQKVIWQQLLEEYQKLEANVS
ncbi:glycosyltransferase family 4 protein [Flavobacterium sp. SM15]|uniref:glycosyltransferase family 4 protein n=1 Tax=Flavobacterium sp. SM15 TaxID=2908005 RepID=UPI001EDAD876|nr:glycosyltransferase family 4 protein [Flavobacterium sp. SM15]MCG2611279.1 glycosyltransferase family 4 protein [Flavobacterium sp. SM15]